MNGQGKRAMDAAAVKERIYARHPATRRMGSRTIPGQWTLIEEYRGIDVLAVSAHASPKPSIGVRYPRVGYEVKISRGDFRAELLNPGKRARAVEWCHAFYLAVPAGLLKPDELAWDEPEWAPQDFARERCRYAPGQPDCPDYRGDPGPCHKGERETRLVGPLEARYEHYRPHVAVQCDGCNGKGYSQLSLVEREAPTLWVPRDLGLVVCDGRGTKLVKRAPVRRDVPAMESDELAVFTRWVSARPDPRHAGVIERAREVWRGVA